MIARRGARWGVVAMAFALGAIATRATPAAAEPRIPPGAAWLHYQTSYVQRIDRAQPARAGVGVAMAGVDLRPEPATSGGPGATVVRAVAERRAIEADLAAPLDRPDVP